MTTTTTDKQATGEQLVNEWKDAMRKKFGAEDRPDHKCARESGWLAGLLERLVDNFPEVRQSLQDRIDYLKEDIASETKRGT